MVQTVNDLWKLLPNSLLRTLENQWEVKVSNDALLQQILSPPDAAPGSLLSAGMGATPDTLQSEFEKEAQLFKESLLVLYL